MDTNTNLDDKLNYILNSNVSRDITKKQEIFLNSDNININFNNIEKDLNICYEKVRVLEDAILQSKTLISTEVSDILRECKNTLNEIENMNNEYFIEMNNFISHNVPFSSDNKNNSDYIDRNKEPLKKASIYNNNIVISGEKYLNTQFKSIDIVSNHKYLNNNIKELILNKPYRTKYELISIPKDDIQELLTITLNTPKSINAIRVIPSNAAVDKITLIFENNTTWDLENINNEIFPSKVAKQIKIALRGKAYNKVEKEIETNIINFFDNMSK